MTGHDAEYPSLWLRRRVRSLVPAVGRPPEHLSAWVGVIPLVIASLRLSAQLPLACLLVAIGKQSIRESAKIRNIEKWPINRFDTDARDTTYSWAVVIKLRRRKKRRRAVKEPRTTSASGIRITHAPAVRGIRGPSRDKVGPRAPLASCSPLTDQSLLELSSRLRR